MGNAGAKEDVKTLAESTDAEELWDAAKNIKHYTRIYSRPRRELVEAGILPALLRHLNHGGWDELKIPCAAALMNVIDDDAENRVAAGAAGAVEVLVALLHDRGSSTELRTQCARVLVNLIFENTENARKAVQASAVDVCCSALRDSNALTDLEFSAKCANILWNIADVDDAEITASLAAAGVKPLLQSLFQRSSGNSDLHEKCIGALGALETRTDCAPLCGKCSGRLRSRGVDEDDGWACSNMDTKQGCARGCTGFGQSEGWGCFRCHPCDFDLCDRCFYREQAAKQRTEALESSAGSGVQEDQSRNRSGLTHPPATRRDSKTSGTAESDQQIGPTGGETIQRQQAGELHGSDAEVQFERDIALAMRLSSDLPPGWTSAIDQLSGRLYSIDHNTKQATFTDPRTLVGQGVVARVSQSEASGDPACKAEKTSSDDVKRAQSKPKSSKRSSPDSATDTGGSNSPKRRREQRQPPTKGSAVEASSANTESLEGSRPNTPQSLAGASLEAKSGQQNGWQGHCVAWDISANAVQPSAADAPGGRGSAGDPVYDVFVSHSGIDKKDALCLHIALRVLGFRTFFDLTDITGVIDDDIVRGLQRSRRLFGWITPAFFDSPYACRELWTFLRWRGSKSVTSYAIGVDVSAGAELGIRELGPTVNANLIPDVGESGHGEMPLGYAAIYARVEKSVRLPLDEHDLLNIADELHAKLGAPEHVFRLTSLDVADWLNKRVRGCADVYRNRYMELGNAPRREIEADIEKLRSEFQAELRRLAGMISTT